MKRPAVALLIFAVSIAISGAENFAQYYFDQATQSEKAGDTIRAADLARQALNRNGDHVPSLLLLTRLTYSSGQHALAQELIEKVLKLDRDNESANHLCMRIAYALKNSAALETCLGRAEGIRKNGPDTEAMRAQLLVDNAQYAVAKRKIDGILRNYPAHTETHLLLAGLYLKLRQYEKAEGQFRKIQNLFPGNSDLALAIARARVNGFFQTMGAQDLSSTPEAAEKALEALKHAYANNPENLGVVLMLAQLLSVTGRCSDALEYLKKLNAGSGESRSIVIFYALCDAQNADAQKLIANYLRRNENDDLTRHQSELMVIAANKKKESANATQAARYHRTLAKREAEQNADEYMLSELRWTEFLFPGYVEAHRDLVRFFRTRKDYERLSDELVFLRDATQDRSYRELVEQFETEKRDLWYVKEGVQYPERNKNPVPVHIYPLRPRDPLTDHPLGGLAIADRTRVTLQNYGRMRSVSREMTALPEAQKFTAENLRRLRATYEDALKREENTLPFHRLPLRFVLAGEFSELPHGIDIAAELVDAESGIRVAEIRFRVSGRNYLNKAAVRLAEFVFANSPLSANIFKILDDDRVLINTGKRDAIGKAALFAVTDKAGRSIVFKTLRRDYDILEAKSEMSDATKHLKAGDVVLLQPAVKAAAP